MKNKNWREEVSIIYGQIMRSSMGSQRPVSQNEAKELLVRFIESILQSKQKEIEKRVEEQKVGLWSNLATKDAPEYMRTYNQALVDLKPIISKILK